MRSHILIFAALDCLTSHFVKGDLKDFGKLRIYEVGINNRGVLQEWDQSFIDEKVVITQWENYLIHPATLKIEWKRCDTKGGACEPVVERHDKFESREQKPWYKCLSIIYHNAFDIYPFPREYSDNYKLYFGSVSPKYTGYWETTQTFYEIDNRTGTEMKIQTLVNGIQINVIEWPPSPKIFVVNSQGYLIRWSTDRVVTLTMNDNVRFQCLAYLPKCPKCIWNPKENAPEFEVKVYKEQNGIKEEVLSCKFDVNGEATAPKELRRLCGQGMNVKESDNGMNLYCEYNVIDNFNRDYVQTRRSKSVKIKV